MNLEQLKRLAGVDTVYCQSSPPDEVQHARANRKRMIERERNIRPGTDQWFELWFRENGQQLNHVAGFRGRTK